jgi:hypothetical protein
MAISETTRQRLETQGFTGLDDTRLAEVEPWLRFTPAVCAFLMGVGTALASPAFLWGLATVAALGAIFPAHPFDLVYHFGIRRLTGTRALPANGAPRRFACGLAAVWLSATGAAFGADAAIVGYAMGGLLTAMASIVALTHFCIPSLIYGALFGRGTRAPAE